MRELRDQYDITIGELDWEPYRDDDVRPLGRHVRHDSRSLAYAEPEKDAQTLRSVRYERVADILDQGSDGACTVEAGTGVLGTRPFVDTFAPPSGMFTQEYIKNTLYKWETENDPFPGSWPGQDTGSDGLSCAKTMQHFGFISGYTHALSFEALQSGLQDKPCIVGTYWKSGTDSPDADGLVKNTGSVRGGHEYECLGMNLSTGLLEFVNSWGPGFGVGGHFFMSFDDFASLLSADGDATFFTALGTPPPTPTPTPTPVPVGAFPWADVDPWLASPHWWSKATRAARAIQTWKNSGA